MSISILSDILPFQQREKIIKDIEVNQIIKMMNGTRTIAHYPYEMSDTHTFLPFFYATQTLKNRFHLFQIIKK